MYAHLTLIARPALRSALIFSLCAALGGCESLPTLPTLPPAIASLFSSKGEEPASVIPTSGPDNPAVAARFAAIDVMYATPGLQPGRAGFSTNAEIKQWFDDLVATNDRAPTLQMSTTVIGQSQKDWPIHALILTRAAKTDAASVKATLRPTVVLVGGQHGKEPAGAEALLALSREVATGPLKPLLDDINVIIVPRLNPDGAALGLRSLANGVDLDTDHLLLRTPEAAALAKLVRDYHAAVLYDAQEYDPKGAFVSSFKAVQRFDALLQFASVPNPAEFLSRANDEWFHPGLIAVLKEERLSYDWDHSVSLTGAKPSVTMGGAQTNNSRNVYSMKNMVSLVVKSRGVGLGRQNIQRRVHTHVSAMISVLNSASQRAKNLALLLPFTEKEVGERSCKGDAVLQAEPTLSPHVLTALDAVTGADVTLDAPWYSALLLKNTKTRPRPCGYWLAATSGKAVEQLRLHGVQVMQVKSTGTLVTDFFREPPRSLGKPLMPAEVNLVRGGVEAPVDSYYISLKQPLAHVIVAALEPDTAESFFTNQVVTTLHGVARVMAEPVLKMEEVR